MGCIWGLILTNCHQLPPTTSNNETCLQYFCCISLPHAGSRSSSQYHSGKLIHRSHSLVHHLPLPSHGPGGTTQRTSSADMAMHMQFVVTAVDQDGFDTSALEAEDDSVMDTPTQILLNEIYA